MSVEIVTAYMFRCDTCNRVFEEGDLTIFVDEEANFEGYEWVYSEIGTLTCPYCVDNAPEVTA